MRDELTQAMKSAMKAGDRRRLSTIRLVLAAIKDRDIALQTDDQGQNGGAQAISDADILSLIQKMIKQRRESSATFDQAGRKDLADQEREEIAVLEEFLPRQMDEAETRAAIAALIAETGAAGLKDMGRVMGLLKQRHVGRMDFAKASTIVKELLK